MKLRTALAAALMTLALPGAAQAGWGPPELVTAPGPSPAVPTLIGSDASLGATYFLTAEALVAGDPDAAADVYRRTAAGFELVTPGTTAAVTAARLSPDAAWLAWQTAGAVAGGDADGGSEDVYRTNLTTGAVEWISQGGNSALYGSAVRGVADNGAVFFTTAENLATADLDAEGGADAYRGTGGGTPTLLSDGDSIQSVTVERVAADGSAALIRTTESLNSDLDVDGVADIYRATGSSLVPISDDGTTRIRRRPPGSSSPHRRTSTPSSSTRPSHSQRRTSAVPTTSTAGRGRPPRSSPARGRVPSRAESRRPTGRTSGSTPAARSWRATRVRRTSTSGAAGRFGSSAAAAAPARCSPAPRASASSSPRPTTTATATPATTSTRPRRA